MLGVIKVLEITISLKRSYLDDFIICTRYTVSSCEKCMIISVVTYMCLGSLSHVSDPNVEPSTLNFYELSAVEMANNILICF